MKKQLFTDLHKLIPTVKRMGKDFNPNEDVYIGRSFKNLPQSKWANPYPLKNRPSGITLFAYENYVTSNPHLMKSLHELYGKKLYCWCSPKPCHGDILEKLVVEQLFPEDWTMWSTDDDPEWIESGDDSQDDLSVVNSQFNADEGTFWNEDSSGEAVVLGVSKMRGERRFVIAITGKGEIICPYFNTEITAAHELAKLYCKFKFKTGKPTVINYPHRTNDVCIKSFDVTGQATHEELLSNINARFEFPKLMNGDKELLIALFKLPYVLAGTRLPSSLATKVDSDVSVVYSNGKLKARFSAYGHQFNFPVTSITIQNMFSHRNEVSFSKEKVLYAQVSLASPFIPIGFSDEIPRCYATLTGLVLNDELL